MSDKKLKLLVVSQYFWPENMRINEMVENFVKKGHEVTVLTAQPNYPVGKIFDDYKLNKQKYSTYSGADIIRAPIIPRGNGGLQLMANFASFLVNATLVGIIKLRGKPFDAIFVYTVSPITAAIPAIMLGKLKKAPVAVWILDLWPETLVALNVVQNKTAVALIGKLVSWIYNRADYLLMQSSRFKEAIKALCTKPINEDRLIYFPSWAEDNYRHEATDTGLLPRDNSLFTLLFAGNVGESQDFPTVLDAAEKLLRQKQPVRIVIVGDGRMTPWLEAQIANRELNNVLVMGRHPIEAMAGFYKVADALFVALKTNEVFTKTIPGKIQSYLAAGKPILGMIDGEAARVIVESGSGITCKAGDAEALCQCILDLSHRTQHELSKMGESGQHYYHNNFSQKLLFNRLEELFGIMSKRDVF